MAKTAAKTAPKAAAKKPAPKKAASKATAPRRDVMQEVTDRIVREMEAGALPWVKPWRSGGFSGGAVISGLPVNFATNRPYSGINVVLLWSAQQEGQYPTGQWLTFKQAAELGGNVRKGERGTPITYFGRVERKNENDEDVKFGFWKSFTVFNVAQCENLPERAPVATVRRTIGNPDQRDEWADAFIASTKADFREGYGEAYYATGGDYVSMPAFSRFKNADNFYATAFHELGHWTGAEDRLNRKIANRFGNESYALEELAAELTAAFCCADFGFDGETRHAGYITHWIKVLREDKNAFAKAASAASKAFLYLRDLALAEGTEAAPEAAEAPEEAVYALAA